MGNWLFIAGATYSSILNGRRRIYAYNTSTSNVIVGSVYSSLYDGVGKDLSFGELAGYIYMAPCTEIVPLSTPAQGYILQGFSTNDIDTLSRKLLSVISVPTAPLGPIHDLVNLGGNLYGLRGSNSASVIKITDDGNYITLNPLVPSAGNVVLRAAGGKLHLFAAASTSLSYTTSTNGAAWATGVVLKTVSYNTPIIADITSTYGAAISTTLALGSYTSDGGSTWNDLSNIPAQGICVADSTGVFVANATNIYRTTNGSTWTDMGQPLSGGEIYNIVRGNSEYMIFGAYGAVATTTDFTSFTPFTAIDFELHDIYGAFYTGSAVSIDPAKNATLITTEAPDTVVITGTSNTGTGVIQGTLRLDNSFGVFAAREVYLYNYTTGAKVAETLSDASTGVWQFTAVAPGDYFVVGTALKAEADTRDFDALGVITVA